MKSERRHELEKNELLQWFSSGMDWIAPYSTAIVGAVVLILMVYIVASWWGSTSASRSGAAWDKFFNAALGGDTASDYDTIAAQYPDRTVGQFAALTAADLRTAKACQQLLTNKLLAQQDLRKAKDDYLTVLKQSDVSAVQERAAFGLARAEEALGELDQAVPQYEDVVKRWPNGALAQVAGERIEDLKQLSTREFYDKFAKAERKSAAKSAGKDLPFDYSSLPEPKGPAKSDGLAPPPMKIDASSTNKKTAAAKDAPPAKLPAATPPTNSTSPATSVPPAPAAKPDAKTSTTAPPAPAKPANPAK